MNQSQYKDIFNEIKRVRGIDLSDYRSETLEIRLTERMKQVGCPDISHYVEYLRNDPSECDLLIDCIAINVSSFFRNPLVFDILAHRVLPDMVELKRHNNQQEIRVWSAGCANGQEPYSMAILIHEVLKDFRLKWKSHIFASDIDKEALKQAASAIYTVENLENTRMGYIERYFTRDDHGYKLQPFIQEMVQFSQEDLNSRTTIAPAESVYGTFDIILCRNVLIYFKQEQQNFVVEKLLKSLDNLGYLILGESETITGSLAPRFDVIDQRNRIYQKRA
jgi:chemotaxis protein methyltransferase CheR